MRVDDTTNSTMLNEYLECQHVVSRVPGMHTSKTLFADVCIADTRPILDISEPSVHFQNKSGKYFIL